MSKAKMEDEDEEENSSGESKVEDSSKPENPDIQNEETSNVESDPAIPESNMAAETTIETDKKLDTEVQAIENGESQSDVQETDPDNHEPDEQKDTAEAQATAEKVPETKIYTEEELQSLYNEQMKNLQANFQQQQGQYEEHFKNLKVQAADNESELE